MSAYLSAVLCSAIAWIHNEQIKIKRKRLLLFSLLSSRRQTHTVSALSHVAASANEQRTHTAAANQCAALPSAGDSQSQACVHLCCQSRGDIGTHKALHQIRPSHSIAGEWFCVPRVRETEMDWVREREREMTLRARRLFHIAACGWLVKRNLLVSVLERSCQTLCIVDLHAFNWKRNGNALSKTIHFSLLAVIARFSETNCRTCQTWSMLCCVLPNTVFNAQSQIKSYNCQTFSWVGVTAV